jgi:hypothetical protein
MAALSTPENPTTLTDVTLAAGVDFEIALGAALGVFQLAAPHLEREEMPKGCPSQLSQALPLGLEPLLVPSAEVCRVAQEIANVQIARLVECLEGSLPCERLKPQHVYGDMIRVQPDQTAVAEQDPRNSF